MVRMLSDYLFFASLLSLIIWGFTSGVFTSFNRTFLQAKYMQDQTGAQEHLFHKPDKKPLLHAFRSVFFIAAVLGFAASVVVSYLEF
ncbi:hypothetical protein [Paenibacillus chitinolyticus]|uniref:hypothetical protein n=1 Tax=Paenibacillus chitinolyticus TaxID=79263 RepID=UPI003D04EB6E